jgi:hypothetical protein
MHSRSLSATVLASIAVVALCAFRFTPRHVTQANPVSPTIPLYGSGLVLGPAEQLPGLAKRLPFKARVYKWLTRKGDTQYVPGLWREADCSLSERFVDLAGSSVVRVIPGYAARLRADAGLAPGGGAFPSGCIDAVAGRAARNLTGGRLPNGTYFGAGPDFHTSGGVALYLSDGVTVTSHSTLAIVPPDSNQDVVYLETGDFNGDGKPDLVVAIDGYGGVATARIAFLAGDGAGAFAAPVFSTIVSGSGSSAFISGFTVADFDRDGKPDIVATADAGAGAAGIVFLAGQGNGTFAAHVLGLVPGYGVIGLDIDGNGILDLATFSGDVLFGDGSGGFTLAPGARFEYGDLAAADFDDDGHVDLAIASNGADSSLVRVWRGDGGGHFTPLEPAYPLVYGSMSADLTVSDLDGDGNADLVVGSAGDGRYGPGINTQAQTQLLLGLGDGRFASPPAFERAVQLAADFDRDGHADMLATDGGSGVRILAGDGAGAFAPGVASPLGFATHDDTPVFLAHDLTGDGKLDLVALETSLSSPLLHVRAGDGNGGFAATGQDLALPFVPQAYARGNASTPALADFDGDGRVDLVAIGTSAGVSSLYRLKGQSGGTFAAPTAIGTPLHAGEYDASTVAAAVFDGDGRPDLALADGGDTFASPTVAGGIAVLRNTGSGFAPALALAGPTSPDGLAVGDADGDGHADVIATGAPGSKLYVFLGHGDGTFAAPLVSDLPDIWYRAIALADIDGDGRADLVLGNCCGLTFAWFARGEGGGHFATPIALPLAVSPAGLALADFDGNGRPDLYVHGGGFDEYVAVYMNTGRDAIFASGFESP